MWNFFRKKFHHLDAIVLKRESLRKFYCSNSKRLALHEKKTIPAVTRTVQDLKSFLRRTPSVLYHHRKEGRFNSFYKLTMLSEKNFLVLFDKQILDAMKKKNICIDINRRSFIDDVNGIVVTIFLIVKNKVSFAKQLKEVSDTSVWKA